MNGHALPRHTTDHPIAVARLQAGLTQAQAAAALGWSRATLANFETGQRTPRLTHLEPLAKLLNCTIYDLGYTKPKIPNALEIYYKEMAKYLKDK